MTAGHRHNRAGLNEGGRLSVLPDCAAPHLGRFRRLGYSFDGTESHPYLSRSFCMRGLVMKSRNFSATAQGASRQVETTASSNWTGVSLPAAYGPRSAGPYPDPLLLVPFRWADKALISSGLPYWGSGIVRSTPPITSPALKSLLGLSLCTL